MNKSKRYFYIAFPWFRLTLIALARGRFHRFRTIFKLATFDWIKTELSIATGTNQQVKSNYSQWQIAVSLAKAKEIQSRIGQRIK